MPFLKIAACTKIFGILRSHFCEFTEHNLQLVYLLELQTNSG